MSYGNARERGEIMRKALYAGEAARFLVLALAVLAILSIYPLRIWQRTIPEPAGGVRMEVTGPIDDSHDVIQGFIAQYDRLGYADVWIDRLEGGRTLRVTVVDENFQPLFQRYIDLGKEDLPGVVRIPLGLDLTVGREYSLFLMGGYSSYRAGLNNLPADGSASPYFTKLYLNDTLSTDWHLSMTLGYRQPMDRRTSLLWILAIAGTAVAAIVILSLVSRKLGPDRDPIVTVGETVRLALLPISGIAWGILFLFLLLRRYDDRLPDNLFYGAGLIILGALGASFFLREDPVGRRMNEFSALPTITRVIEIVQAVAFALGIQYCCDYMNGLYDADHAIASRREVIAFAVFLLLFLAGKRGEGRERCFPSRLNLFGILAVITFVLLIAFRNGRLWGVTLGALFAAALVCYALSPRRERWLSVLTSGLFLHFGAAMIWCLLHRYFAAFVSARFPFIFHTVTVTAEYLTMMGAAAFALLMAAICRLPRGTGLKEILTAVRPEAMLFGTISAYLLFTVSRTGILALSVTVPILLIVIGFRCGLRRIAVGILTAFLAVLLLFPAVFTLQRILPPMVGRPYFFVIDDADPHLRGAVNWDNRYLIGVERFCSVFLEKIAGIDTPAYRHPEDRWNYDENGDPIYESFNCDEAAAEEPASSGTPATAGVTSGGGNPAASEAPEEEQGQIEQMANGRFTIWKSYLPALNLTGHAEMGVLLPDGEMAVHAHNVYLQTMYDHGIIAGAVFVLLLLLAVVTGTVYGGMRGETATAYVPLALTLGFMVAGLTEWNYHLGNMMTTAMLFSWVPLCFKKR